MRRINPAASRRRFRRALKGDRVRSAGMMFHVKQFLLLLVFHGKQSCFSVRQAAARPIPSIRCHSERSEESPNFEANPSSTCGDSSSQAPQNDNEKRNDGGQPSEITIVSRETSSRPTALCPSSNARLNLRREAAGFILRMFQLYDRRSSEVGFILRLVRLNLSKPAGIAPFTDCKTARPMPTPFP